MADPAETDDPAPKKDWRKELEDRATSAETQLVEANTRLAFFDAGLGDLTEDQRDDVLTFAKAKGLSKAEDLKAIADRFSFTKTAEPASAPSTGTETLVEQPGAADLAELARLAAGSPGPEPRTTELDLSQFATSKELKDYLMTVVDDSFGPTFK